MKIETQLPLGNLDPGLRAAVGGLDLGRVGEEARLAEALGYDGIVTEETKDDPFVVLALAAQATERMGLATGVAIAFPRAPAVTALAAWTLQRLSKGRFTLGLGSQVKGHIERRYGMSWTPPGPWMRDYVGALRAIWECWQNGGTKLNYESEHYKLSLMVPLFAPPPIERPDIPVQLAAVNSFMCQIAGEVADGIRAHPVCTPCYIEEVMLPAARKGAAKNGRDFTKFEMAAMPLIATAPDRKGLDARIRDVRARIAFYASTPTYLIAFESQGYGEVARSLQSYSRAQRWEEMPGFISDEMLDHYAVIGMHDEIAGKLKARFAGVASRLEFAIPIVTDADRATLGDLLKSLR
ncbi:MAG TPA: TIGR03617 family F420-dependent LLM class oxidoreductase [Stellaceae bacterium]|jgi:probable F420-dependent oxidoreductase|nr:TIGR03617 family F420-dependent LLM class oxidoreductase [Stellaceae bacterium]